MRQITRVAWFALLTIVFFLASPPDVCAQSFVCYSTRHGESATQAARRLTGNGQNAYQPWFEIMDRSSRFIPKSQYNRIRPDWRACVSRSAIESSSWSGYHADVSEPSDAPAPSELSQASPAVLPPEAPSSSTVSSVLPSAALASADAGRPHVVFAIVRGLGGLNLTMLWLCTAMSVSWCGWRFIDNYLARRKSAAIILRHFAQRFVDEFERPLLRCEAGERPVKSHIRFGVRRDRFELYLAPGEGRRYPNLSDHKKNVEYDVARVRHVLADNAFVSGAPYTHGDWIVVPFKFTAGPRQSGVPCNFSL